LSWSQELTTGPYPEPVESSLCSSISLPITFRFSGRNVFVMRATEHLGVAAFGSCRFESRSRNWKSWWDLSWLSPVFPNNF
jgi:hypothetical protein